MSDDVLSQVPDILERPIIVMESKTQPNRLTMFGEVYGDNGVPVMAVLELLPTSRGGYELNELKLVNAYTKGSENNITGKKGTQSIIDGSEILYVEPNKNRTNGWLSRNQLQLPLGITAYGPIGSISLVHRKSNGYFSSESQETEVPEWKKKLAEFSAGGSNNNSSPKSGNASVEVPGQTQTEPLEGRHSLSDYEGAEDNSQYTLSKETHYYTHTLGNKNRGSGGPVAGAEGTNIDSNALASSDMNSIREAAEKSNNNSSPKSGNASVEVQKDAFARAEEELLESDSGRARDAAPRNRGAGERIGWREPGSERSSFPMPEKTILTAAEEQTCPAVGYQSATVCVPVTVIPYASAGETYTRCCGTPVVTAGQNTCGGTKNGTCVFTISQDLCMEVPVVFGATAEVGSTYVTCNGASAEDICTDCGEVTPEA